MRIGASSEPQPSMRIDLVQLRFSTTMTYAHSGTMYGIWKLHGFTTKSKTIRKGRAFITSRLTIEY